MRQWLRNVRPNIETPVQPNEPIEKRVKMFAFQKKQMQILAVSHSENPIPDKNNDQNTSRKHLNENHWN